MFLSLRHTPVCHQPEEDTGHHGVHQEYEAVHEAAGIEARAGGGGGLPHGWQGDC